MTIGEHMGQCAKPHRVTTWADGFGVWHASVPTTDNPNHAAHVARAAIKAELLARAPRGATLRPIRLIREEVASCGGAVTYKEV